MTQLSNLVIRKDNSVMAGFKIENVSEDIQKAKSQEIEKALEFEKTGTEIATALKIRIDIIKNKIKYDIEKQSELIKEIGSEPDVEDRGWGGEEEIDEKYKRYAYSYSDSKINEISVTPNDTDGIDKKKMKYNDLCWSLQGKKSKLRDYERLVKNLNASGKKKYKLSEYELSNYGF